MGTRLELQSKLETILGSSNVYFQPPSEAGSSPTSARMQYPAIKYTLSGIPTIEANNKKYHKTHRYMVILIHSDPDNTLKDTILDEFDYISFSDHYKSNNLNHYVYTLYY